MRRPHRKNVTLQSCEQAPSHRPRGHPGAEDCFSRFASLEGGILSHGPSPRRGLRAFSGAPIHKTKLIRKNFLWLILLLIAGLLLPAAPALAAGGPPGDDGIVIWNEDYTLEKDEWVEGDLVVFNGDVTLEPDSRAEGSVIVWNGSAEVKGTVEGDLVVTSGDIYLDDDARIEGDVVCSWSCDIEQEAGAQVDGSITEGIPLDDLRLERPRRFPVPVPYPLTSSASGLRAALGWMLRIIRSVAAILVVAAVAGLVALIWPQSTAQVGQAMVEAPLPSFGVGLLTIVAGTALVVALTITICLSPVAILAALVLGAAGLFGWAGVGAIVGERLLQALNAQEIAPLWTAGLGTLLITLVVMGMSVAFCLAPLGWLMTFVLGCLGLGAVVLTRFGTTAYTPPSPAPPPSDAASPPEPQSGEEESKGDEAERN
jgi:hypothetical protein